LSSARLKLDCKQGYYIDGAIVSSIFNSRPALIHHFFIKLLKFGEPELISGMLKIPLDLFEHLFCLKRDHCGEAIEINESIYVRVFICSGQQAGRSGLKDTAI
jgi:hypothetical protein